MTSGTLDTRPGVFETLRATPRPVRYLLGGVLVNQLGAFIQTFLVLYMTFRGFSLGQAGTALTMFSLGTVLGTLVGGELTHRLGARATIISSMTASALVIGTMPLLGRPERFGYLLVSIVLAGLATQCYRPAVTVLISQWMPREHQVMAFSMMRIALNIGAAGGPLIAAGLILLDWSALFWFDAFTALVYAALAVVLLPKTSVSDGGTKAPNVSANAAYSSLLRDWRFLLYLLALLLNASIYIQYTVALPLKVVAEGHSTSLYSAALALSSTTLILCELKITSYVRHWPPQIAGATGLVLLGLGLGGYGLSAHSATAVLASTLVFVSGLMISGPAMFAHPATFPATVRARYIGVGQSVFGLGSAAGATLGVLAWSRLHNGIWLVCAVTGVLAAILVLVGMRRQGEV